MKLNQDFALFEGGGSEVISPTSTDAGGTSISSANMSVLSFFLVSSKHHRNLNQ